MKIDYTMLKKERNYLIYFIDRTNHKQQVQNEIVRFLGELRLDLNEGFVMSTGVSDLKFQMLTKYKVCVSAQVSEGFRAGYVFDVWQAMDQDYINLKGDISRFFNTQAINYREVFRRIKEDDDRQEAELNKWLKGQLKDIL